MYSLPDGNRNLKWHNQLSRKIILDVGGALVTIARLITDVRFICKVKDEFVQNKLTQQFEGIKSELDEMYNARFE